MSLSSLSSLALLVDCFQTSEKKMAEAEKKNQMEKEAAGAAEVKVDLSNLSDEELYKIDVPANRYDLLCLEGITRALRIFLEKEPMPTYKVITPPKVITVMIIALLLLHLLCS